MKYIFIQNQSLKLCSRNILLVILLVHVFKTFSVALNIKCNYVYWDLKFASLLNIYTCDGTISTVCDASPFAISASVHPDGKHDYAVEYLTLPNYQYGPEAPKDMPSLFPNLLGLSMTSGSLKGIYKEDLRYHRLLTLHLGSNQLRVLNNDLFTFAPNVILFSAENNQIKIIGWNIFEPLNLQMLNLLNNPCISWYMYRDPVALQNIKNHFRAKCRP